MIGSLSPREAVISTLKARDDGDVKGYYVQTTTADDTRVFSVPKTKQLSIIAEEAKKREKMPSP